MKKRNRSWCILVLAMFLSLTLPLSAFAQDTATSTQSGNKLLIYYATPKLVNNLGNDAAAAAVFAKYDYVVFGAGLDSPTHSYHVSTQNIIQLIHSLNPSTKIFGYVDLGVSTNNFPTGVLQTKIMQWKQMGVNGIFLDDSGYDFLTPRERLNTTLDFIHNNQLSGFVNAWKPDDVLGSAVTSMNPTGAPTHMGRNDFYLLESFVVNTATSNTAYKSNGGYALSSAMKQRGDKVIQYKKQLGVKMLAINIVDYSVYTNDQIAKFFQMAEVGSLIFGLDGYGVTGSYYSASGANRFIVRDHAYNTNYNNLLSKFPGYTANTAQTEFARAGFKLHNEPSSHWWNYRQL
ncbi:hypothetical protein [Paenibacillus sp. CF384]|uniref:hypothetical protein n=1 Tax=Paenibacillus sp. CF384 TaxID=1884382 RepID=UPI00089B50B5|nr:hypothetical protein [Paenibacillus sp. CF384]SDW66515.1 hypothetical protein SAMN05518855_100458 [Paenibacillus sp. CF384]